MDADIFPPIHFAVLPSVLERIVINWTHSTTHSPVLTAVGVFAAAVAFVGDDGFTFFSNCFK